MIHCAMAASTGDLMGVAFTATTVHRSTGVGEGVTDGGVLGCRVSVFMSVLVGITWMQAVGLQAPASFTVKPKRSVCMLLLTRRQGPHGDLRSQPIRHVKYFVTCRSPCNVVVEFLDGWQVVGHGRVSVCGFVAWCEMAGRQGVQA